MTNKGVFSKILIDSEAEMYFKFNNGLKYFVHVCKIINNNNDKNNKKRVLGSTKNI